MNIFCNTLNRCLFAFLLPSLFLLASQVFLCSCKIWSFLVTDLQIVGSLVLFLIHVCNITIIVECIYDVLFLIRRLKDRWKCLLLLLLLLLIFIGSLFSTLPPLLPFLRLWYDLLILHSFLHRGGTKAVRQIILLLCSSRPRRHVKVGVVLLSVCHFQTKI